jgi:hypothetical protein
MRRARHPSRLRSDRPSGLGAIFVRIGNFRRAPLLAKFESVMQNLIQALDNGDTVIEIA